MLYIIDDVLEDPHSYRERCLAATFHTLTIGEAHFHGMATVPDRRLCTWVQTLWPDLLPDVAMLRRSPAGQLEPSYIHTDRDMGDWSAIYYLNPHPAPGDGTTFWCDRASGSPQSLAGTPDEFHDEWVAWRDDTRWEPWATISAKFNRIVVFDARHFHSRALFDNYGRGDGARLIQLLFGTGILTAPQASARVLACV